MEKVRKKDRQRDFFMLIPFYFRFLDYILKKGLVKVINKL
ncbi:hypothetical protein HPHPH18_1777 [Helicobacter pylori Hp H-18]|nr:hypothetical protein HPHPH18_1777 [Helicobacter pylori Hp H-18]